MRSLAGFEDEYQFVLGAIQRTHAGIALVPDTEVLDLAIDAISRAQELSYMTPVHAHIMNRARLRMMHQMLEAGPQEGCELLRGHFTGGHREFPVFDATEATDMAVDADVIGWVDSQLRGRSL